MEFSESWKKSDFRLTHLPKKSRRLIANSFWHTSLVWILWFDQVFHFCLKKYLPIKHFSLFVIFWAANQGSSSLELRRSVKFRLFYGGNALHSKAVPAIPPISNHRKWRFGRPSFSHLPWNNNKKQCAKSMRKRHVQSEQFDSDAKPLNPKPKSHKSAPIILPCPGTL